MSVNGATLHKKIRTDIAEQILSGAWPPGRRIPFEHELMTQYGCSRMTVNKALSPLAEDGLIVRRRGAGSFVSQPRIHAAVLDIPDIQAEIAARGEPYSYELLSRALERGGGGGGGDVDLGPGPILALTCLHRARGRPFALEERHISLVSAPAAETVDFTAISPGAWLLGFIPWTEAEHRISAVNVSRGTAKLLDVAPTAACLSVERRTWRGDDRITQVRMLFPGDVYDLVARFAPRAAAAGPG